MNPPKVSQSRAEDWLRRDEAVVWHPYTPVPSVGPKSLFVRAEGAYLFDSEGKRYFDSTSSWWCNIHGHCHPRLVSALAQQAATLDQILFAPHTHSPAIELSERLIEKLGPPFERIFFSDDGSTAVEAALKMAVQYWQNLGRKKRVRFLSLERGYHGDTLGAVAVSHVSEFHRYFTDLFVPSYQASAPYCYRCPEGLRYPSCQTACLKSAEKLLAEHHEEIAAIIVEPLVMGAGGMILYPPEYLEKLVALARRYGLLVIFDEVFSGFGRTGTFFAMDSIPSKPDIVCLSKGLTSGMLPLAVTATTGAVYDAFRGGNEKTLYHGHTFTANALGVAVALESLKLFDEEHILERNRSLIAILAEEAERFRKLDHVGDVRHRGTIWAAEIVLDKSLRLPPSPANGPGWKIAASLWKSGQWMRPMGNIIYCIPPYCTSEGDLRSFFSLLYSELQNERHFTNSTDVAC